MKKGTINKAIKLLIIEDNESLLLLMNHYFKKQYDVYASKNGLDAMSWLSKGVFPDLILLDWDMPIMSGEKFLEGIKTSNFFRNIPVIIISANSKQHLEQKEIKADHYFLKPFDPKELNVKIQQTLCL